MSRKDKLIQLREMVDLETGVISEGYFVDENALYRKGIRKKALDSQITKCEKCEGLNIKRFTEACCGWGNLNAKVFIIGQSLHKPGVVSGLPFILGSGYMIDAALRLSDLRRRDVFFTNVIHCHPPNNRTSTLQERRNCLYFLKAELNIVNPDLVLALGADAKTAIQTLQQKGEVKSDVRKVFLKHPAALMRSAPAEQKIDWIIKLSNEIDKVYK